MEPARLLEEMIELAREAGFEVRAVRAGSAGEGGPAASSGVCRVRGAIWVLLAASDPVEERIEVLSRALRCHAGAFLESRYLPPAVRSRLGGGRGSA